MTVEIYSQSNDRNYILTKTLLNSTGTASVNKIDYYNVLVRSRADGLKEYQPGPVQ